MTQAKCRVIALAPGRDVVSLQQIAQALCGQIGGDPQQLLQQLQGTGVVVAELDSSADADHITTAVTRAGADYRVVDEAGLVLGQGSAPQPQALNATIMGGFGAPAGAPSLGGFDSLDEADLLTLDEAQATEPKASAAAAQPVHANVFIDLGGEPSGQAGPVVAPEAATQAAPAPESRDALDGLNAGSLMLLDGTIEQKAPPPPPLQAVVSPSAPRPAGDAAAGGAFAPPAPDPSFLPDSANDSLELDTSYSEQAVTGPIAPETLARVDAATEAREAVPDTPPPPPVLVPEEPPVEPEPRSTGRRDWFQPPLPRAGRSARRRAQVLLLHGRLRAHARLRVAIGFAVAILLGSVLPMCHAGSVMNSRVHTLRVELSTARARGSVRRASGFQSVEQIEQRISSVKTRSGIVTFLIWLSSSGLLLFLWFRFT